MFDLFRHRGPYDYGRFCEAREGAHRRLASVFPADISEHMPLSPLPKCRHFIDGTADCDPSCLFVFGDQFFTVNTEVTDG
jgi:hypothetical protein